MSGVEALRELLPEHARDVRLNLQTVLADGILTPAQRWGVAVASAAAARSPGLLAAMLGHARREVQDAYVDDALAAASLMGMNNVYYRFRHLVGKPEYAEKPARLRMNRMARPLTSKAEFELFSLAVSAINGCETCIQSHEKVVVEGGLTADHVHDAVRIAATIAAAAVALEAAAAMRISEETPALAAVGA